jgi:DNA polymerase III epsilon subunit family exonuclease
VLSDLTFVAFDVETTGLEPLTDRIVEIGALKFDCKGTLSEYQQLVNPRCPIPLEAIAIHRITDKMVASSPTIATTLPDVIDFFGDSILIAHNAPFDIGFFDAAFARAGVGIPDNRIFCTLQLARSVFPGLPGYSLEALVAELKLAPGRNHRALADAAHAADIFRRCVERMDPGWNMTVGKLLRYHGPPFRFVRDREPDLDRQTLTLIKRSIEKGTSVRIEYQSSGGKITSRSISPQSIDERGTHLKVVAFCHLRGERRTFRLDCIKKIELSP